MANPWSHIPGLNMQSYGQNSQQSSPYSPGKHFLKFIIICVHEVLPLGGGLPHAPSHFASHRCHLQTFLLSMLTSVAAWPPPMPDAWNQAMQMPFPFIPQGAFPPPPVPGLNFPPMPFPQAPTQSAGPAANPFQPIQQPALPVANRITEVADNDKEDGGVSEGDARTKSSTINGNAPREAPRPVPQSNASSDGPVWKGHRERYNPEKPATAQSTAPSSLPEKPATKTANFIDTIVQQREEAKQFVKLLHGHNVGYRDLAAEGLDPTQLRALYRSLNLPSEPEPVPLPRPSAASATPALAPSPSANGAKSSPSAKTNVAVAPPAAPSPVDRKEYIARLQAAKKGKQAVGAQATPPQTTTPSTVSMPAVTSATQPNAEEEKARQTLLIKQRLDALQKSSSSPGLPARPPPNGVSSPAPMRMGSSPVAKSTPKTQQAAPSTPYSGIPGLFMNSPVPSQTQQATSNPRKRPLASDFVDVSTPVKQTDADGTAFNLPSRPASAKPVQSAASTPGAQTPSSQARSDGIKDNAARLAAMKLVVIQKLKEKKKAEAEAERLKKLAEDKAGAANVEHREAKRLRREQLQTDLAAATDEEAAREAKIREFEKQLAELQAHDQQMKMEKARLIRELEELGIDTEGMPHEDLRAKKDEIEREQREASVLAANAEPTVAKSGGQNGVAAPTPPTPLPKTLPKKPEFAHPVSNGTLEHPVPQKPASTVPTQYMGIPGLGASFSSQASSVPSAPSAASLVQNSQPEPMNVDFPEPSQRHIHQHQAVENIAAEKTAEVVQYATPMDEDEDFYSPKPAEEPTLAGQVAPPTGPDSPSEDGEVAMSLSEDEEEYQPDEPLELPDANASQHRPASPSDDDEDAYEPPDVDVPVADAQPRGSSAETGEVDDGAMDISSSDDSDDSDSSDSSDSSEESQAEEPREVVASHGGAEQTADIADDLAPELQPGADSLTNEQVCIQTEF